MNWDAVGAVGEILGAVAVMATLFYLSIQIKQSNALARRSELNSTTSQVAVIRGYFIENPEIVRLYLKGQKNYSDLDNVEASRFNNLMNQMFWVAEQQWDRSRIGAVEEELWTRTLGSFTSEITTPGGSYWWEHNKHQFPQAFVDHIESKRSSSRRIT